MANDLAGLDNEEYDQSSRWEAAPSLSCQEQAEHRVVFGEVVHPTGEPADGALPGESVEGDIDYLAAANGQEVCRDED